MGFGAEPAVKSAFPILLAAALGSAAAAAQPAERRPLSLPAGRLGDALVALGQASGISIGVADPALANMHVSQVRGNLTVDEALARLLRGRGARAVRIDARTIRIVRQRVAAPVRPRPSPAALPRTSNEQPVEIGEIVVTSSRRSVPLAAYPGSVSIVGGDDPALTDSVQGTQALVNRLPSLGTTYLGPGRNKLFVRGISDSSFSGPTQATVGQYLGEARLAYTSPDPDLRLIDIDRIEVLAGPQGTLYGAGSLGGIVRVVPNAPELGVTSLSTLIGASLTRHGDPGAEAAAILNAPLVGDRTALRLNFYAVEEGGYIEDLQRGLEDVNRVRIAGGRLAVRAAPDEYWTIDLGWTGQRLRGDDAQFADRAVGRLARRSNVRQNFGNDYSLLSLAAAREWDDLRFVAAAGWVEQRLRERYDITRTGSVPGAYDLDNSASLLSFESRLSRRDGEGAGWLVGASLLASKVEQRRIVDTFDLRYLRNVVGNDVVEGALFSEGAVRLRRGIIATVGARLSYAHLENSALARLPGFPLRRVPLVASRSETTFLPSASLSANIGPELLAYGRYQQSFRPGGLAIFGDEVSQFRSDRLSAVEAGLRYGRPGVGKFDASFALAYTSWSDIQADSLDVRAEPTVTNIGDGRIYTLDFSAAWRPRSEVAVEAAAVLNDSRLTRAEPSPFLIRGGPLPNIPRLSGRIGAHHYFAVGGWELRLSGTARYIGKSRFGFGPVFGKEQGGWLDLSAGLRADAGRYSVTLGLTNLLDSAGNRFALGSPFAIDERDETTPLRPRTFRLGLEARF